MHDPSIVEGQSARVGSTNYTYSGGNWIAIQKQIFTGQKSVNFQGAVSDLLSDNDYNAIVGRSYTGADTVNAMVVTTGTNITVSAFYHIPSRTIRLAQTYGGVTIGPLDIRYSIIAHN